MIRKILVSQPEPASEKNPYTELEKKHNVKIVFRPFIKVESVSTREFRDQRVQILDYSAIVFTSKHAIDFFFRMCKELRINIPDDMKYFVISETVSYYIQHYVQYRKRKVFWGKSGKWADLLPVILKHKGEKFLIPQNDKHNTEIEQDMQSHDLNYTTCVMFRTVSAPFQAHENFDFDMVVLFHPSGLQGLLSSFKKFEQGDLRIATFGNTAAQAIRNAGLRLDLAAPNPKAPSMASAIDLFLQEQNSAAEETPAAKKRPKKRVAKKAKAEVPQRSLKDMSAEEIYKMRSEAAKRAAATRKAKAEAERKAAERRKEAAKRAAATRKAKAEEARLRAEEARLKAEEAERQAALKRSEAAKRAAATRKAKAEAARKRSEAAKKGAATKRAKAEANKRATRQ